MSNDDPVKYYDLGDGHRISLVIAGTKSTRTIGGIIEHQTPAGTPCSGFVRWARSDWELAHPEDSGNLGPIWTLAGEPGADTFTLDPSVLCNCGDHGWIRSGRWQRA